MAELAPLPEVERPADLAEPGALPALRWIPVASLLISRDYQRPADSPAAVRAIAAMAAGWDWAKVGAIVVAPMPEGERYEVIDGQHRAAAALARGDIHELPAVVIAPRDAQARPDAFLGINRARRGLSPLDIFWASAEAGEGVACAVMQGAEAAGARILRRPSDAGRNDLSPGATTAVGALQSVARDKGKAGVARVLRIAIAAGLAPVLTLHVQTIAELVWGEEFDMADDVVANAIADAWDDMRDAADLARLESGQPLRRCMAVELSRWARRVAA
ncbi:MAG: ParB N-terminal domain-containing protein [Pseudomonadota bacterium]|nr:ParB N-terminal domain-containing protein [Pseudomonadota bacterium]MEE3099731.1 ParB N-terminal domain-containing protein [Pseudomonadota bacterium]